MREKFSARDIAYKAQQIWLTETICAIWIWRPYNPCSPAGVFYPLTDISYVIISAPKHIKKPKDIRIISARYSQICLKTERYSILLVHHPWSQGLPVIAHTFSSLGYIIDLHHLPTSLPTSLAYISLLTFDIWHWRQKEKVFDLLSIFSTRNQPLPLLSYYTFLLAYVSQDVTYYWTRLQ